MKKVFAPILISCLIMPIGCNSASDTSPDEQKIKDHIQSWIHNSEDGDTDRYFDFVTDDFIYYGPGEPPIDNLDSLRAFLESFFKYNTFSMPNWETHEIIVKEDMAIHLWSGIAFIESKDGETKFELDRKYLDVYRKDNNGKWKCYVHSYNDNN